MHKCCHRQVSAMSSYTVPVSRGHDNNAKVATQYFSVIRNLERALGQRARGQGGNGAWQQLRMHLMHINCVCGDT